MHNNNGVLTAIRTLLSVARSEMSTEKDRLDSVQTLVDTPDIFNSELSTFARDIETLRTVLSDIQKDPMTSDKGRVRAARLSIQLETLIARSMR